MNLKVPLVNKLPYHKEIGMAGINIESARLGAALANKFLIRVTAQVWAA